MTNNDSDSRPIMVISYQKSRGCHQPYGLSFLQIICIICVKKKKKTWQGWQDGSEDNTVLVAKTGDLSLIPGTHIVEGETQLPQLVL